jgi:hypothetical protein
MTTLSVYNIKPWGSRAVRGWFTAFHAGTDQRILIQGNHKILTRLSYKDDPIELSLRLLQASRGLISYGRQRTDHPAIMRLLPDIPAARKNIERRERRLLSGLDL